MALILNVVLRMASQAYPDVVQLRRTGATQAACFKGLWGQFSYAEPFGFQGLARVRAFETRVILLPFFDNSDLFWVDDQQSINRNLPQCPNFGGADPKDHRH